MSDHSFKAGDKVRLKSGGPAMTVEQVGNDSMTNDPMVWCVWFVGTKLEKETFAPATLEIAPPSGPVFAKAQRA